MAYKRGFLLIEIIVSIFIFGIMLLMLQSILQSGVLIRMAKNQGIALSIARNELEKLRAEGYETLPSSGPISNTLLETLPPATEATLYVSVYNDRTKQVVVNIEWKDSGATASSTVSLSTLITQTGGLP